MSIGILTVHWRVYSWRTNVSGTFLAGDRRRDSGIENRASRPNIFSFDLSAWAGRLEAQGRILLNPSK